MPDIQSLLSVFSSISPSWENGECTSELEQKFQTFADFIWNNTFHDEVAVKPTVSEDELSDSTNVNDIERNLKKTESMVRAFHLSRKIMMSEEFSKMTEEQVKGLSIVDFCKKYGYSEDYLHNMFEREDVSKTIQTYIQYSEKIKLFVQKVHVVQANTQAISASIPRQGEPIPLFFERVELNREQISMLCQILKEKWWLDRETEVDDFVFFFTGRGDVPTRRLKWRETSVLLSLFLKELAVDSKMWHKASKIFLAKAQNGTYHAVNAHGIASNYSGAIASEAYGNNIKKVKAIIQQVR